MVVKLSDFLNTSFSTFSANDTNNTGITYPGAIVHNTTLTPGVGIGAGLDYRVETSIDNAETGMRLEAVTTDVTAGSEDFDFIIKLMENGATASERVRVTSSGNVILRSGDGLVQLGLGTFGSNGVVGTITSDSLFFRTNNVDRLRIGTTGTVDVYNNLYAYGLVEVQAAGLNADFYFNSVGGSGRRWLMTSGTNGNWSLYDSTGSNNRLTITPTGSALIYSANSIITHQLDYSNQGGRVTLRDDTGTSATRLEEQINATRLLQLVDGSDMILGFGTTTVATGNLMFMRPGYNESARIDATGNLLIGRVNSTVGQNIKLDVNGAANASQYYINEILATAISNSFTSATIAGANSAVGTGANAFASATIAGANNFFTATIAGANSAVGTGANNYLLAVIAGANSAVGTGANNYQIAIQNGANTAVGTGANAFAFATITGANSAVGTGANSFASATIAGANSAVGTAANNFAIATFGAANTRPVGNTLSSIFTSRSTRRTLNFIPGSNITINVDDDSAGDRSNVTIASTSSGGTSVFSSNVGNASANTFNIAHNLAKTFVIPAVRENSTGYYVYPDIRYTTPNHIVLEFVSAPTTNQYTVIVLG